MTLDQLRAHKAHLCKCGHNNQKVKLYKRTGHSITRDIAQYAQLLLYVQKILVDTHVLTKTDVRCHSIRQFLQVWL